MAPSCLASMIQACQKGAMMIFFLDSFGSLNTGLVLLVQPT